MSKIAATPEGSIRSRWLPRLASKRQARFRLFCFPYAGGDALSIYRNWSALLPSTIEICPVQIPGRGNRLAEPLLTNFLSIVEAMGGAIEQHRDRPFAFFGHSMGAMLGFELSRLFRQRYGVEPQILFVSGRRAPQLLDPAPSTYALPKQDFLRELERMKGTPKEVLENAELMELMVPILKADFQVCQTYTYTAEPPLGCPIVALGGLNDDTTREEIDAWRQQTISRFTLHMFSGDHFFIKSQESALLQIIASRLMEFIPKL